MMNTGKSSIFSRLRPGSLKQPAKNLRRHWLFWVLAALAAGAAGWQFAHRQANLAQNLDYSDRGEMIIHGVRARAVSYSMPLLSLLGAAQRHLAFNPALPARAAELLLCLAAFGLGSRGGGPARGALFALSAALVSLSYKTHETEQALYSLALLLFLNLELLRQSGRGLLISAASGAAAGITLLIRSPLFFFPPLASASGYFYNKTGGKKWLLGSLLFLLCAYLPLAPWARLNHGLFGRLILLEQERPTCNIITGAMGMVYTIEGDARAFAGLSRTESVYPWAIKTVLAHPYVYAASVVERIRQVFLMFPYLFLLAGFALFLKRSREKNFLAFFCGYFILIHCLLSIEERYFYPLKYVLALIAAGGVWELIKKAGLAAEEEGRDYFTMPLFLLTALLAAYGMSFVYRYPSSARPGLIALEPEIKKHPSEPWLLKEKGKILLSFDLTAGGLEAVSEACALGKSPGPCYITAALKAGKPAAPPAEPIGYYELLLVKMLRETELGRAADAKKTFKLVRQYWLKERNLIRGIPKKTDKPVLERIIETNKSLWNTDIYSALFYFPPGARPEIIKRLGRITRITPELERLSAASALADRGIEEAQDYDMALAYLKEILKSPYLRGFEAKGLPARPDALFAALNKASNTGELEKFLLESGPSTGNIVNLYLNSATPEKLSGTALKISGRSRNNPLYPLTAYLALRGPAGEAVLPAIARAFDRSPSLMLAAARLLADSEDTRKKAGLLADYSGKSGIIPDEGRKELALLYQNLGLYEKSLLLTRELLLKEPRSGELNNSLGVLLMFMGRGEEAETALLKAREGDNTAVSPVLNLAALYARRGDLRKSAFFYRSALENPALPPGEKDRVRKEIEKDR
ncbi:MAG: hypothetical protein AUJ51_12005 [Elusimicrobia bacterium CG1_02_56_21]|nr:MAG: hypothetical protein AUJ51_12005 [Elusimicrobia bacterium CG1_02_56_21]